MREIKFRGKRIDNGEWVYGDLLQNEQGFFIVEEFEACNPYGDDGDSLFGMIWHQVIPETVGQYTGLKDKNGVEIYEGDILKFSDRLDTVDGYKDIENEASVWWLAGGFILNHFKEEDSEESFDWILGITNVNDRAEIIGNIYDNPELLESKP